jgi:hypothetical protein
MKKSYLAIQHFKEQARKLKQSPRYLQKMKQLELKKETLRNMASKSMNITTKSPSPKYYYLKSLVLIGLGGLGMAGVLKYQN